MALKYKIFLFYIITRSSIAFKLFRCYLIMLSGLYDYRLIVTHAGILATNFGYYKLYNFLVLIYNNDII